MRWPSGESNGVSSRPGISLPNFTHFTIRGIDPTMIDLIIVATITQAMFFSATACLVHDRLSAKRAWGFDLSAACSGFVYALMTGAQFISNGSHKRVLVIGADTMTRILGFT